MTTINLDKNFFFGGNATFTVENGKGTHYTFKIRQPKKDWANIPFFASLLTGPDNENSYSYLGMVNPENGMVTLTKASRMTADSLPVKVLSWALKHALTDRQLPDGYNMRHEGKCGCCGRKLTEPTSLDRGIGPECWLRIGGRA